MNVQVGRPTDDRSGFARRGQGPGWPSPLGPQRQKGARTRWSSTWDRCLSVTDAFVITSGSNPRQVRTIVEEIEEQVKAAGGPGPLRIEGLDDASWVLMDFGDFVVHTFGAETRAFYDLDGLWADAGRWEWQVAAPAGVD